MKLTYFFTCIFTFTLCIIIVLFFGDFPIIRGFVGDMLIMLFLYTGIKIFVDIQPLKLCLSLLIFAFGVEFLQLLNIVKVLGLEQNKAARIIIGNTFDPKDLLAYTFGIVLTYWLESIIFKKFIQTNKNEAKNNPDPKKFWYSPKDLTPKHQCPCCDYISLPERDSYLICPICFWEDEGVNWDNRLDDFSGANKGLTLRKARKNFTVFGVCDKKMSRYILSKEQRKNYAFHPRKT